MEKKEENVGEFMSVTGISSRSRVNGLMVVERQRWFVGVKERGGEGRSKRRCLCGLRWQVMELVMLREHRI